MVEMQQGSASGVARGFGSIQKEIRAGPSPDAATSLLQLIAACFSLYIAPHLGRLSPIHQMIQCHLFANHEIVT